MEHAARESDVLKRKLMARVDSLESDRRFLYEQEKSLTKKVQALEEDSIQSKVRNGFIVVVHSGVFKLKTNPDCYRFFPMFIVDGIK